MIGLSLTLDQPNGLNNVIHAPLVVACHAYFMPGIVLHIMHIIFLKTLFECMFLVNCLMFRLCGEKRRSFAVEAPISPCCQRQVAHKLPIYLDYAFSGFISICMFRTISYAMQTLG